MACQLAGHTILIIEIEAPITLDIAHVFERAGARLDIWHARARGSVAERLVYQRECLQATSCRAGGSVLL